VLCPAVPLVSVAARRVRVVSRARVAYACADCGQQTAQWVGRCPGCAAWGTIDEAPVSRAGSPARSVTPVTLDSAPPTEHRIPTGIDGLDRVLGGGLVPASVVLVAGEPGIGKSTLLLSVIGNLTGAGSSCLLVSGEESHDQVASRARRIGVSGEAIRFASGRDLHQVIETARAARPAVLAVDSIQTLRDPDAAQIAGGVSQVRACADAIVGFAKSEAVTVILTGHVTKDGEVAGPRALEHAVDVVLAFDGDHQSGFRSLTGGKNRFGAEGETAWFEMGAEGLREIDPTRLLVTGDEAPGAAVALPRAGRRSIAVEVQALVGETEGPARRQATGLDLRRFQLVAAVLDRVGGVPLGRAELFGAAAGGVRVDDPACDLAVAAALVSAATGLPVVDGAAFVGEVALTGIVRPVSGMAGRLAAARAAGRDLVFAPQQAPERRIDGVRVVGVRHVADLADRTLRPAGRAGVIP
jgi:DNA repair protein RadA/Sms